MMEIWETKLRAKLLAELPDGAYDISVPGFTCLTGKLGYIESEVAFKKACIEEGYLTNEELNKKYETN